MDAQARLGTIDFERLREERLARCFEAMDRSGVDVLVLGREANVRFVTDARRLWLAGPRPFGPGCIVVAATREVHLLATSDEGVPRAIPSSHLYPLTWNPEVLASHLARIDGLRAARRIGVDGWNAAAGRLLAKLAPEAIVVDGASILYAARRRKTEAEIACLRAAAAIAADGLDAVARSLPLDVEEGALRGVFAERVSKLGAAIPSLDGRFRVIETTPASESPSVVADPRSSRGAGELVVLRAGVVLAGYEGTLARTVSRDPSVASTSDERTERAVVLFEALVAACRAGAAASGLLDAYRRSGEELPTGPIARGVGLGSEPPLVGAAHACVDEPLDEGMVLSLRAAIVSQGSVAYEIEEPVRVGTRAGGRLLSPAS